LAKSVARAGSPQAFRLAGLPRGWRHEALSVALATPHLVGEGAEERELALWLIGTHHGRGRPFFAHLAAEDIETVPVTLDDHEVDAPAFFSPAGVLSDHTERFSRLLDRYGPHRLAWLEAILRLADHRASEAGASPGAYE
jgi:CRISPR-associated endonuclease/helicase Cas3